MKWKKQNKTNEKKWCRSYNFVFVALKHNNRSSHSTHYSPYMNNTVSVLFVLSASAIAVAPWSPIQFPAIINTNENQTFKHVTF